MKGRAVLNPSALYRFETDADHSVPRPGVLVVSLGAFVDAGQIQSVLGGHLLETGEPEVVASFDVDQLLDYRGRRPAMVFDTNRWVEYDDPTMLLHRLTDRDGQTYYVLTGPEPTTSGSASSRPCESSSYGSASRWWSTRTASRWRCRTPARSA